MSEFLRSNPKSFENEQESDSDIAELAVNGLSRVIGEHEDETDNDDYYGEDNYGDSEYDEEDNYDDDYGEERADFDEEKLTLQEILLPAEILERYSFLSELPHGVAVMGGVARSIAREIITGERESIRDIDLINITDEEGNSEVDYDSLDELSRKFMPDDYTFDHGVGNDTLDHYFRTRDFTVNQSLIKDSKLIVSNFAYNDFQENIIRPTYFEHPYDGDNISSRLFLKALMMRSVFSQISDSIPLIEDMDGFFIPPVMSHYHASNPVIRRAIAEYEDGLDGPIDSGEERISGYYTQAEYDEINRSSAYNDNTMIIVRH